MNTDTQNEDSQLAKYFVDANLAEVSRQNLPVLVSGRLCYMCRQNYDYATIATTDTWVFVQAIVSHCTGEQDYLLPDTPLKEAIFRVLLASEPIDAEQISEVLNKKWSMSAYPRNISASVIERLLNSGLYHCVGLASEQDTRIWRSQLERMSSEGERTRGQKTPTRASQGATNGRKRRGARSKREPSAAESQTVGSLERNVEADHPGDPLARSDSPVKESGSPELGKKFEKLLYWLSSVGGGTWQTFAEACLTLGVVEDKQSARSVLRRLRLLGHVDCSRDGTRWEISPSAVVICPAEPSRGFLTGQRVPSMLNDLNEDIRKQDQPNFQGPLQVTITVNGHDLQVDAMGQTSARLSELLPELDGWKDSLPTIPRLVTAQFEMRFWDGREFQPCYTFYQEDGRYFGQSGMYHLSRLARGYRGESTLFFDEPGQRWLRGDWYGLRFLALEANGAIVEVVHDSGTNTLQIPEGQRWPLLFERALVLASGLLPMSAVNSNWLQYQEVPFDLAKTLCNRLGIALRQETNNA